MFFVANIPPAHGQTYAPTPPVLPDPLPHPVQRGLLVSADRDILAADIPGLVEKYGASAADWESGAIAWVAKRNGVRCLILGGVTDLVSANGGEAYGNIGLFHENTKMVMERLIEHLPDWLKESSRGGRRVASAALR
jgi:nucleoside phosphorylase